MNYPDLTPRSDPEGLQKLSYDPYGLITQKLPSHPRVFFNNELLNIAKHRIKKEKWARYCFELLLKNCETQGVLNNPLPVPADASRNNNVVRLTERNALAFLLTGKDGYRRNALRGMSLLKEYCQKADEPRNGCLFTKSFLSESHIIHVLGYIYDLLATEGFSNKEEKICRFVLEATKTISEGNPHKWCSNINTWGITGQISVALALGNLQWLHDALYGQQCGDFWRYGLIHQLRHDILSDGLHWERTIGYHYYTLMALTDIADMLKNSGIDIWHRYFPTLKQDDGKDLHRAWGPAGEKCLKSAYDAPFYTIFQNGDMSVLHDSGLANIRGIYIWGIIYDKAYEAYHDKKYAWLINRMEREYGDNRQHKDVPMCLQTHRGDLDFVRLSSINYPKGEFSLKKNTIVSLCGRHENFCTLFPVHGTVILRAGASVYDPGAYIYFGPHVAGHQAPAALHLDVYLGGKIVTGSPRLSGYDDPLYLTWGRTTLAHNTVVINKKSMFPYDFETESIWECDRWRDNISDGELVCFKPQDDIKIVRARNTNVYPGCMLDRTIMVSADYVIDVFRVATSQMSRIDWVTHLAGKPIIENKVPSSPYKIGNERGYKHLYNARQIKWKEKGTTLWGEGENIAKMEFIVPPGTDVVIADEPSVCKEKLLGALSKPDEQTAFILSAKSKNVAFVSVWSTVDKKIKLHSVKTSKNGDVDVYIEKEGRVIKQQFVMEDKS